MPITLYDADILEWSRQQADRLRRLAAGERVNDVDWSHVVEEIEDVGRSELRACKALLLQATIHLLKLGAWPAAPAARHWTGEVLTLLAQARDAYARSMRQHLDIQAIHRTALGVVRAEADWDAQAGPLPERSPYTLDDLLAEPPDVAALVGRLRAPGAATA